MHINLVVYVCDGFTSANSLLLSLCSSVMLLLPSLITPMLVFPECSCSSTDARLVSIVLHWVLISSSTSWSCLTLWLVWTVLGTTVITVGCRRIVYRINTKKNVALENSVPWYNYFGTFFLRYCPVTCVWEELEWELTEGALEWESDKTSGCFNACLSALVQPYRSVTKKAKKS